MSFAGAVDRRVKAATGERQIKLGTIQSASAVRVMVTGLGEQAVACDWSAQFAAEMLVPDADLVGKRVEVHVIDGQNIVAYTIVIGEKPNGV